MMAETDCQEWEVVCEFATARAEDRGTDHRYVVQYRNHTGTWTTVLSVLFPGQPRVFEFLTDALVCKDETAYRYGHAATRMVHADGTPVAPGEMAAAWVVEARTRCLKFLYRYLEEGTPGFLKLSNKWAKAAHRIGQRWKVAV